jgi:hypothetical protein
MRYDPAQLETYGAGTYRNGIVVTAGLTAVALLLALIDRHRSRRAGDEST